MVFRAFAKKPDICGVGCFDAAYRSKSILDKCFLEWYTPLIGIGFGKEILTWDRQQLWKGVKICIR